MMFLKYIQQLSKIIIPWHEPEKTIDIERNNANIYFFSIILK